MKKRGIWVFFIIFSMFFAYGIVPAQELPTVAVVATGGTIAMKIDPETGGPVPALSGEDLVSAVPELKELANIRVVEFSNIPSDYMTPELWLKLSAKVDEVLADPDIAGVVITHGTDTLEETAYFLDLTLKSDKPVVCIGAQRSASEKDSDGPRNLLNAVRIILSPQARGKGVMVALNHYINAAREVRKVHTSNVQTFESGDYGYLGYVDQDRVVFFRESVRRQKLPLPQALPRVDLVAMYTGADGSYIRHAVDSGAKGIVVQAFGWGNVNKPVYEAIKYAISKGVSVVISTRVYYGRVLPVYGFEGGGATLKKIGAVFADDLPPWKARILLMLALTQTQKQEELQNYFDAGL
ncbi:MAG: asparaginase [Deltaproteobacteria bacterium]|nr:asparaginase [Deltaproteobacteria bacterium]MBW2068235.1 asparaginase [Deltaproteobacteria bacterium]